MKDKDYSTLTNEQVATEVAYAAGIAIDDDGPYWLDYTGIDSPHSDGQPTRISFDPCNNASDAWPIIIENHIAVIPYRHTLPCAWPTAFGAHSRFYTEDANLLRAAMIAFLKMKDRSVA